MTNLNCVGRSYLLVNFNRCSDCFSALVLLPNDAKSNAERYPIAESCRVVDYFAIFGQNDSKFPFRRSVAPDLPASYSVVRYSRPIPVPLSNGWRDSAYEGFDVVDRKIATAIWLPAFDKNRSPVEICYLQRQSLLGDIPLQNEVGLGIANSEVCLTSCFACLPFELRQRDNCCQERSKSGNPSAQCAHPISQAGRSSVAGSRFQRSNVRHDNGNKRADCYGPADRAKLNPVVLPPHTFPNSTSELNLARAA